MAKGKNKRIAVFLDRDGVINEKPSEHDYVKKWQEFEFLPDVAKTIRELNKKFLVIVISNQKGVARGIMSLQDVKDLHSKMKKALRKQDAKIDGIYFCPHSDKDDCQCRKPKPGMIFQAAKDFQIDLNKSYIVGDSFIDIEAGKKAGCKTILVGNFSEIKKNKIVPDYFTPGLLQAVKIIKKHLV